MIGRIYKITSSQTDMVYIGSTKEMLCQRIRRHRCRYNKGNYKCTSREILKYEDNQIELIEEVDVETKKDLERIEADYILKYADKCVNRYRNLGYDITKDRNYYKIYREKNKEKRKTYNEANKEKIREQNKKYKEANKEKIALHSSEKIICECGAEVGRAHLARHKRSKIHLDKKI